MKELVASGAQHNEIVVWLVAPAVGIFTAMHFQRPAGVADLARTAGAPDCPPALADAIAGYPRRRKCLVNL